MELCKAIHGLSAHSLDHAHRRAQSADSGNPWIELKERGFAIAVAPSRKERGPSIAGGGAVHERLKRVARCVRVCI